MTARQTYILAFLLIAAIFCRADGTGSDALNTTEYRAELERLLSATQQLDSSGNPIPQLLRDLPKSWRIHTDQREFEISTEGLRRDIRRYEGEKNVANASAIRGRLQSLRSDLDGYEKPPADASANRAALNSILARPEFRDVQGPNWVDRLKQRLLAFLFRSFGAPVPLVGHSYDQQVSRVRAHWARSRSLWATLRIATSRAGESLESVVPTDLPVSAKEWAIWLEEARAAAAKSEWRDAIHLAYWAGISFLERQGTWKPDRARTPREYLRLLASSSEHRETLKALTQIFELAWYAKRDASERTFSQTLQELEKLGCH